MKTIEKPELTAVELMQIGALIKSQQDYNTLAVALKGVAGRIEKYLDELLSKK